MERIVRPKVYLIFLFRHQEIPLRDRQKKEAHSEEVPESTPATALQYTQNRNVPNQQGLDTPTTKVYCIRLCFEVAVQIRTFTISLPKF